MIRFCNWKISCDGPLLAMQYDNLTRELRVAGNLPEGYDWAALVQVNRYFDIIALERTADGAAAVLTAEQLFQSGYYTVQLRGTQGEKVRHTNTIRVAVGRSLSGDEHWPEIPSEFTQLEQRVYEAMHNAAASKTAASNSAAQAKASAAAAADSETNAKKSAQDAYIFADEARQTASNVAEAMREINLHVDAAAASAASASQNKAAAETAAQNAETSAEEAAAAAKRAEDAAANMGGGIDPSEIAGGAEAIVTLAECGVLTPAYENETFYTDTDGAIYIL